MLGDRDAARRVSDKLREADGGDIRLPFDINAHVASRGSVVYIAAINGDRVTSARFSVGDADKRRKVASEWAKDMRLRVNGATAMTTDIREGLERAEFAAVEADEAKRGDDGDLGDVTGEAAGFVDDAVVAELAWSHSDGRADFIVYDRATGEANRLDSVATAAGTITVPSISAGIVTPGGRVRGSLYVPSEHDPSGEDETRLRLDVTAFINRYVELPGDAVRVAVEYVLLSWVFDVFDELPYMAFRTADAGRGKSRALETVGAICRRPMFVGGGSSAAATLRLLDVFGGTLVADEFDFKRDTELAATLSQILNQGFQSNRPLVKCTGEDNAPRPFTCFGPKLFALRKTFPDDATETRTLSIYMRQRTRNDIPLSLPRAQFDTEALALRNRLLVPGGSSTSAASPSTRRSPRPTWRTVSIKSAFRCWPSLGPMRHAP